MTGMSISGKMSVGISRIAKTPPMTMSIAITTNVYGRRSARRTIHTGVGLSIGAKPRRFQ